MPMDCTAHDPVSCAIDLITMHIVTELDVECIHQATVSC